MHIRRMIIAITCAVLFLALSGLAGCVKQETPVQTEETTEEHSIESTLNTVELTYDLVERLNEKSSLLGVELLGSVPEREVAPGPITIDPDIGEDYLYCFPYDGKVRITQIFLVSEDANVYGVCVGDQLSSISDVLTDEGYAASSSAYLIDESTGSYRTTAYQKGHVSIEIYVSQDSMSTQDSAIAKISIIVDDPNDNEPDY